MRFWFCIVWVIALTVSWGANAAARPPSRLDPITRTCRKFDVYDCLMSEGYNLFQEHCKSCHSRDNDLGAPFIYSESKTPEAWTRVFFERYPQCAGDGSWDGLDLQDLLKINDYLYRFGAGTFDPNDQDNETC